MMSRSSPIRIVRQIDASSGEAFSGELASAVRRFRGSVELADDETIIVLEMQKEAIDGVTVPTA